MTEGAGKELATARPRGRYFEEFEIGDVVISPARTVTETDIVLFAGLSGDYNPLHTDIEFAKGAIFGQRVAHGLLGLAMASGLGMRLGFIEGTAEAFRELSWKFSRPIFIGDTIHIKAEVAEKKPMRRLGGGMVTFNVVVINQREETVQKGQWMILVKSKPASD